MERALAIAMVLAVSGCCFGSSTPAPTPATEVAPPPPPAEPVPPPPPPETPETEQERSLRAWLYIQQAHFAVAAAAGDVHFTEAAASRAAFRVLDGMPFDSFSITAHYYQRLRHSDGAFTISGQFFRARQGMRYAGMMLYTNMDLARAVEDTEPALVAWDELVRAAIPGERCGVPWLSYDDYPHATEADTNRVRYVASTVDLTCPAAQASVAHGVQRSAVYSLSWENTLGGCSDLVRVRAAEVEILEGRCWLNLP